MAAFTWMVASCSTQGPTQPAATATVKPRVTATFFLPETNTPLPSSTITPSPTASSTPTGTPTPAPSPTPTMSPLVMFSSPDIRPGIEPQAYLKDPCAYLQKLWSPDGSPPGTVVVPVMFHSIVQEGTLVTDPKDITGAQFNAFVYYAHSLGFETITTQQLLDFLQNNVPIPPRSMVIIVDDRRPGLIRDWIMPVLEENNWTVTSAYIADPNSLDWAWKIMDELFLSGRLDVQSHGYTGDVYIVDNTPLDKIQNEIWNSTPVLEQHFGNRPIAFIWPGGNFTPLSVQVAREGGYQLGFTAYSRGPLLFNWIPLGEQELAVNDPLMVLPRAWSSSVNFNLDEALKISQQAASFAHLNFPIQAAWYRMYCGAELPHSP